MNELIREVADQASGWVQGRPIVALAVGDSCLRDTLRDCLQAEYGVRIVHNNESAFTQSADDAVSILVVDGAFDKFSRYRGESLLDSSHSRTVPLVRVLDADEVALDKPIEGDEADGYISQPIVERQLMTIVRSLTALSTLTQKMAARETEQDQVLDNFNESYIAVDSNWKITHVNAATEKNLHMDRHALVGRSVIDIFPDVATGDRAPLYLRAMEERVSITFEDATAEGDWFEVDAVPISSGGLAIYFRSAMRLKEAEAAASTYERRMRLFLEHAKDYAFAILDPHGRVVEWLGGAEAITGWSAEERVGKSIETLLTSEEQASGGYSEEITIAARTGRAEDKRWLVKKDGGALFVDGVTAALCDEAGELQGFGKIFRDSTSEKLAEEALCKSREQLQLILNSAADGICGIAADGHCTFINPAAAEMLGYVPQELNGRPIDDLIHHRADGSLFPRDECKIAQAIRNGTKVSVTDEVYWRKDGTSFPVHYSVNPMETADGEITGAVIAFSDVTETKRAEAALQESERKLRFVMDSMPQKIFSATPNGDVDYLNPAWMTSTGLPFERLRGWGWTRLIHPHDLKEYHEAWRGSIMTGASFRCEYRYLDARSGYRWNLSQAQPLRDDSGHVAMWVGSNIDIHDMKTTAAELTEELAAEKRSAARLADLAAASHALNADLSVGNVIHILTERTRQILGVIQAEVSLSEDEYRCEAASALAHHKPRGDAVSEGQHDFPMAIRPADGAGLMRGGLLAPLIGPGGKDMGRLRVSKKIEGEFSEEDKAILAQLSAIAAVSIDNACLYESLREQDQRKDEFLATLAHELRNPLAPLRTGLDLLKLAKPGEQTRRVRDMMERQLAHMVRLVDDLMDVSRVSRGKIELKRERVSITTIIDTAVEATSPLIDSSGHRLKLSVRDESLQVFGDATRLAQVISNLLNNAAKYTLPGGRIELTAERQGSDVVIKITDTGVGIPKEMLSKIFELFTQVSPSTDRSRGGVGIGLALVKKLVELHGGTTSAESPGFGGGSTFTVRLPLLMQNLGGSTRSPGETGASNPAHRHILVVDDNVEAADTLKMLLEYSGHEVTTAHSGIEAVEVAGEFKPDVVFLDIGLPGMSGYEVATILRRESPVRNAVIIALTGWGGEEDRRRAREAGFDYHLTKPVDAKILLDVLAQFSARADAIQAERRRAFSRESE